MSFTWVVIAVVMIALLVFGLLLFLTNITGHVEHKHPEEAHGGGEESAVDTSKIASEFLSAVWREKKARREGNS
ncbi:MAG: hypothetical protein QXX77_07790 [Candidatus Methanosuratincola sp.]|jgi:hypothetical protein